MCTRLCIFNKTLIEYNIIIPHYVDFVKNRMYKILYSSYFYKVDIFFFYNYWKINLKKNHMYIFSKQIKYYIIPVVTINMQIATTKLYKKTSKHILN